VIGNFTNALTLWTPRQL